MDYFSNSLSDVMAAYGFLKFVTYRPIRGRDIKALLRREKPGRRLRTYQALEAPRP